MMMNYHLMTIQKKHIPHRMCFFCMYVLLRYIGWFTFFKLAFFYVCSHLPVYSSPTFFGYTSFKIAMFYKSFIAIHTYSCPTFGTAVYKHAFLNLSTLRIYCPVLTKIKYAFFYTGRYALNTALPPYVFLNSEFFIVTFVPLIFIPPVLNAPSNSQLLISHFLAPSR